MNQRRKATLTVALICFLVLFAACRQTDGGTPVASPQGGGLATARATEAITVTPSPSQPVATSTAEPAPTETPQSTPEASEEAPDTATAASNSEAQFDGAQAFAQLEAQMAFGPRWPGSPGHAAVGDFIIAELEALGWQVEEQPLEYRGVEGRNIIGRANEGAGPVIIIGAHYDTRRIADQTPGGVQDELPVPGAVDGASGVAVLLELARTLDLQQVPAEIWLAFFDMEDNGSGGLEGWDWIVGSTQMAENLTVTPQAMVLVDMIGDADQQLYYEGNSDVALRELLWSIAADLGYGDAFIPQLRYTMIDDHVPFVRRGIPAVDIIDFDYPYWHTVEDTTDKASAESLERVGRTIEYWLEQVLE